MVTPNSGHDGILLPIKNVTACIRKNTIREREREGERRERREREREREGLFRVELLSQFEFTIWLS